jgi:DNA-binding GntR family transcriptional regulator
MAAAVEKAYRAIREGILSGVYAPGSHIRAQDLAAATGISRTPVREAMGRLHAEGMIEIIANRGAFVCSWSEQDISQIYDLRVLLEGYAAEAAAANVTPAQLAELRALAEKMTTLVEEDPPPRDAIAVVNQDFHRKLLAASGNARMEDLLAAITELPLARRTFRHYSLTDLRRSAGQHLDIVRALGARDGAWARSVMAAHILSARHTLVDKGE